MNRRIRNEADGARLRRKNSPHNLLPAGVEIGLCKEAADVSGVGVYLPAKYEHFIPVYDIQDTPQV